MKKLGLIISAVIIFNGSLCAVDEVKPKITAKRVEFRKMENKVIFTGDVVITRGKDTLYADKAVKDEKESIIEAWGSVKGYFILESGETARLKAGAARWDLISDRIELTDSPEVVYLSASTGEVSANSDLITMENASREVFFKGNAVISYGSNVAKSNLARYFYNDKKIILLRDGDRMPFIKYAGEHRGDFTADTITVYIAAKNMILEKNVECLLYQ